MADAGMLISKRQLADEASTKDGSPMHRDPPKADTGEIFSKKHGPGKQGDEASTKNGSSMLWDPTKADVESSYSKRGIQT